VAFCFSRSATVAVVQTQRDHDHNQRQLRRYRDNATIPHITLGLLFGHSVAF
jgi:hypothetical protein